MSFSITMFVIFIWGFGYILELAGSRIETKYFWEFITFIGVTFTPVAWLVFAFEYTQRKAWATTRRLTLLSILPSLTLFFLLTNRFHGLFRHSYKIVFENGFHLLKVVNGPWFWVNTAYAYLLITVGLVMIIRALLRWPVQYRGQMFMILLATFAPLIANIMTIFNIVRTELDLTPYAFTISGIGMTYALFRHRFLDIAPIARDVIIDGMKDGIITLDAYGRIVDINRAAQRMIGLSGENQPLGKSLSEVFPQWAQLTEKYQDALEAEDEISIGDGESARWYELKLSTINDENTISLGQVIIVRDITDQKFANARLHESEERFRQLVENASDLIYRTDENGYFTYANPAALYAMGYEKEEEVIGKFYLDLTTPDYRHKMKRTYQHQFATRNPNTYNEFPGTAMDGREIWFGQNVQLIYDGDKVIGFQVISRDITAIKQAQESLRIAHDQALEASNAKSHLLSKVSHELRTPLNGILGYAVLLKDSAFGKLNNKQIKAASEIVDSTEYLAEMVNELLDESQLRSSTATLQEKVFSPSKLVQASISGLDIIANNKGLIFSAQVDPNIPEELLGDDRRIRQIIINLIGNAIKFTQEGAVRLNVNLIDDNYWQIEVSDTGIGIPQKAQENIFEPFKQVSNAITEENRGVGLGLSITKQLVDLMYGRIHIKSEPGKGSVFIVVLPLKRPG